MSRHSKAEPEQRTIQEMPRLVYFRCLSANSGHLDDGTLDTVSGTVFQAATAGSDRSLLFISLGLSHASRLRQFVLILQYALLSYGRVSTTSHEDPAIWCKR